MKSLLSILFCLALVPLVAQDLIVKMDDEEIIANVVEIKKSKVAYQAYENQEADPVLLDKSEIYMIIYEDGMRQFFSDPRNLEDVVGQEIDEDDLEGLYLKGMEDAEQYYDRKGIMWATMGATVIPSLGIFTGGILVGVIAMTPANYRLEELPDPELYRNAYYAEGFQKQAKKIRIKRALTGMGIGAAIQAVFFIIIFSVG